MAKKDNTACDVESEWDKARNFYSASQTIEQHASDYFKAWPNYPPDAFDVIDWNHPKLKRTNNRNRAKWTRATQAVSPNGFITRLFNQLVIPTFITFPLTELGFTLEDSSYKNYQDKILITEVKDALREQIAGASWFSIEVSRRKSLIHPHVLCEHDTFNFDAYIEPIYEPKGLVKYLIKGIPYNAGNLAVYWKAHGYRVRKTGTIRVPYKL